MDYIDKHIRDFTLPDRDTAVWKPVMDANAPCVRTLDSNLALSLISGNPAASLVAAHSRTLLF